MGIALVIGVISGGTSATPSCFPINAIASIKSTFRRDQARINVPSNTRRVMPRASKKLLVR